MTNEVIASGRGSAGILRAAGMRMDGGILLIRLAGLGPGVGYNQLQLAGDLTLGPQARLIVQRSFAVPKYRRITVVDLAPGRSVRGTFMDLPEGRTLNLNGQSFRITYRGGVGGNDVVLTALDGPVVPTSYYLTEGMTDGVFEEEVHIANPNGEDAPADVTVTFECRSFPDREFCGGPHIRTLRLEAAQRASLRVSLDPDLLSQAFTTIVQATQPIVANRTYYRGIGTPILVPVGGDASAGAPEGATQWHFAESAREFIIFNPVRRARTGRRGSCSTTGRRTPKVDTWIRTTSCGPPWHRLPTAASRPSRGRLTCRSSSNARCPCAGRTIS